MSTITKNLSIYAKQKFLVEQNTVRVLDSAYRDDPIQTTSSEFSITLDSGGLTDVVGVQVQSAMIPNPLTTISSFNDKFVFSTGFGCRRDSIKKTIQLRHKNYVIQDIVSTTLGDTAITNIERNSYNLATILYSYGIRIVPTLESDSYHGDLNYLTFISLFPLVIDSKNSTCSKVFGFSDVARTRYDPIENVNYNWSKNGLASKVFYQTSRFQQIDETSVTQTNLCNHYLYGSIGTISTSNSAGIYATTESLSVNSVTQPIPYYPKDLRPLMYYMAIADYSTVTIPSGTITRDTQLYNTNYYAENDSSPNMTTIYKHPPQPLTDSFESYNSIRTPTVAGNTGWYLAQQCSRMGGIGHGVLSSIPSRYYIGESPSLSYVSTNPYQASLAINDVSFTIDIAPNTMLEQMYTSSGQNYSPDKYFTSAFKSNLQYGDNYTSQTYTTVAHQRHTRMSFQSNMILDGITIDVDPHSHLVREHFTKLNLTIGTDNIDSIEHKLTWVIHDYSDTTPQGLSSLYNLTKYYYRVEVLSSVAIVTGEERVVLDDDGNVLHLDVFDNTTRTTTAVLEGVTVITTRLISSQPSNPPYGPKIDITNLDIIAYYIDTNSMIVKSTRTKRPGVIDEYSDEVLFAADRLGYANNDTGVMIQIPPLRVAYTPKFSPLLFARTGNVTIGYVNHPDLTGGKAIICEHVAASLDPYNSQYINYTIDYRLPWKTLKIDSVNKTVKTYWYGTTHYTTYDESTSSSGVFTTSTTYSALSPSTNDFNETTLSKAIVMYGTPSVATNASSIDCDPMPTFTSISVLPSLFRLLFAPKHLRPVKTDKLLERHLLKTGVCRIVSNRSTYSSAPQPYTTTVVTGSGAETVTKIVPNEHRYFLELVGLDGETNAFTDVVTNMIGYIDWQFESNRSQTLQSYLNACKVYDKEIYSAIHKYEKVANSIRKIRVSIINDTGFGLEYRLSPDSIKHKSMMMNPRHSNNITLSDLLTTLNKTEGLTYGYPNVECHFSYRPGTVRPAASTTISEIDVRTFYYNSTAALDSTDWNSNTYVPGNEYNMSVNYLNFAGSNNFVIQTPNYVNFIPTKRLVLRCPELESLIDVTSLNSNTPSGIAIFAVSASAKIYNTMEGISIFIAGNHRFQPIAKLTKLTLRIENETGALVDMGGLDYYVSIQFSHLVQNRMVVNDTPMSLSADANEDGENIAIEGDELDDMYEAHLLNDDTVNDKVSNEKVRIINQIESEMYAEYNDSMMVKFAPHLANDLPFVRSDLPANFKQFMASSLNESGISADMGLVIPIPSKFGPLNNDEILKKLKS